MDKIQKKIKYYSPYKLFDVERRSRSQLALFKRPNLALNSSLLSTKNKIDFYNYSKKLKSTILSSKIFSQYMNNYIGLTQDYCFKSPSNSFYPKQKNFHLIPFRKKRNLSIDENKSSFDITRSSVIEKPYGYKYKKTKIIINKTRNLFHSAIDKYGSKIFLNFIESKGYNKILMKTFGLENIDINNSKNVIKDNYSYLQNNLNELESIENFVSEKEFEYNIKNNYKNENLTFNMKITSICLNFFEISEIKEDNKYKIINKKKLNLPFKLLPLFYSLKYADFKNFISEILYYDIKNDSMDIDQHRFKEIVKKYARYIKNNFSKNDLKYIKKISFNKNEFIFQRNYNWIVSVEEQNMKKPIYKLKISFPKIIFENNSQNIKIVHHLNKNVLLQILKKNFVNWEKLVLFYLFSNKQFRYIINNILIGGNKFEKRTIKLYENLLNIINRDENKDSKNFEFFLTDANRKKSYYYIFIPNIILVLSGEKKKIFQKVKLSLLDSQKLYQISKYWGVIDTLLRCMYKDEITNKIDFKINILNDLPKVIDKTIQSRINHKNDLYPRDENNKKERNNFIEYKIKDLELLVTDCLLKNINITINEKDCLYFKVPKGLFHTMLIRNDNLKIIKSIQKNFYDIIDNENEINILEKEEIMIQKAEYDENYSGKRKKNKKYTFKSSKSKPNKTFNRMKTLSSKIRTDNSMLSGEIRTFNKKAIIFGKLRSEEKELTNTKIAKITKFLEKKDGIYEVNEENEIIKDYNNKDKYNLNSKKNKNEDIKENFSNINSGENLKKFKFGRKFTIDFRKKI